MNVCCKPNCLPSEFRKGFSLFIRVKMVRNLYELEPKFECFRKSVNSESMCSCRLMSLWKHINYIEKVFFYIMNDYYTNILVNFRWVTKINFYIGIELNIFSLFWVKFEIGEINSKLLSWAVFSKAGYCSLYFCESSSCWC